MIRRAGASRTKLSVLTALAVLTTLPALATLAGCRPTSRRGAPPMPTPDAAVPCLATVTAQPDGDHAIRFDLANAGDDDVTVSTIEPFLAFDLRAADAAGPVPVEQPALDLPVRRVTLTIPAHSTTTLHPPIRLRIAADATPSTERFVWTIVHAPADLTLTFTLQLPAPYDQPCTTTPAPSSANAGRLSSVRGCDTKFVARHPFRYIEHVASDYAQRLRGLMARAPRRDAAMIERQRESFVYGNLKVEESKLTRDEVALAIRRAQASQ